MRRRIPSSSRRSSAFSGVIDPHGNLIGDALIDDEGIVYAEIDLNQCIQPKQMHDIIGGYNRFDIFDLRIDRSTRHASSFIDPEIPPTVDQNTQEQQNV